MNSSFQIWVCYRAGMKEKTKKVAFSFVPYGEIASISMLEDSGARVRTDLSLPICCFLSCCYLYMMVFLDLQWYLLCLSIGMRPN